MRGETRGERPPIPVPWGGGVPAAAVSRANTAALWEEWEDGERAWQAVPAAYRGVSLGTGPLWGGETLRVSFCVRLSHGKDAEEWGEKRAELAGAPLSGRASEPPGADGIAPGGEGCWQIQFCVEYYGPKWERLVV